MDIALCTSFPQRVSTRKPWIWINILLPYNVLLQAKVERQSCPMHWLMSLFCDHIQRPETQCNKYLQTPFWDLQLNLPAAQHV